MTHFTQKVRISYWILIWVFILPFSRLVAQDLVNISGNVSDADTKEPLIGVNILVKGKVIGTITDVNGNFNLRVNQNPPLTLVFSMVGFATKEVDVTESNLTNLLVNLEEQTMLGQEFVVSASRVEESILQSPVSIEKMDILAIRETASDTYYKAIANLKGVDVTSSSINFQILNARGFNSTGNTRFVQLIDGMDTQAPALNFPIGNLNGPSELDVESAEFIPGASSALYGPNAFNGILLINSKNPFEYQGLSAVYKQGFNHFNGRPGEPQSPQPMYEGSIRYAKALNNKFAFKISASFMQAEDWYGTDLLVFFGSNPANDVCSLVPVKHRSEQIEFERVSVPCRFPDPCLDQLSYQDRVTIELGIGNRPAVGEQHSANQIRIDRACSVRLVNW
jgi:iron complex outermembrane recepter protein